jgi:hypothetical protein
MVNRSELKPCLRPISVVKVATKEEWELGKPPDPIILVSENGLIVNILINCAKNNEMNEISNVLFTILSPLCCLYYISNYGYIQESS